MCDVWVCVAFLQHVELMITVTVCFKLSNGNFAIVGIMAFPSTVYVMDII
jgi:hypothetical protein